MKRHYNCKEPRPVSPKLPPSHIQAFSLLRQLAELEPGERLPIGSLEGPYGNPCDVVKRLRCRYGWDINTHEDDSPVETRLTEGYYYLTKAHHAVARRLFDEYFARSGKGGGA